MGAVYEKHLCGFQGIYYTSNTREWESNLSKRPITVCGETIYPGDKTTLNDFFSRPIEYLGKEDNEAVFFIGSDENLFNRTYYYEPVLVVKDNRIFKMYSNNGGRDFNYINQKWK